MNLTKFKIHNKKRCWLEASKKRYLSPNFNKFKKHFFLKKNLTKLKTDYNFVLANSSKESTASFSRKKANWNVSPTTKCLHSSQVVGLGKNKSTKHLNMPVGQTVSHKGNFPIGKLTRKKYNINSYLYQVILRLSRKYDYYFLGKEIFRQYYTSPFRVDMTRFIMNKILRGYYKNLSYKALLNIRKKITNSACGTNSHYIYKKLSIQEQSLNKFGNKKPLASSLILNIEQRLDSSVLRLLHFRTRYSYLRRLNLNYANFNHKRNVGVDAKGKKKFDQVEGTKFKTYPQVEIKSLWGCNYTALQIKQFLNHGHIQVNDHKVTYGGYKFKVLDKLKLNGFIPNLSQRNCLTKNVAKNQIRAKAYAKTSSVSELAWAKTYKYTVLLRQMQSKKSLDMLRFKRAIGTNNVKGTELIVNVNNDSSENCPSNKKTQDCENVTNAAENLLSLYDYIKDLKIKRFTEIFYITYKNMHLLSLDSNTNIKSKKEFLPITLVQNSNSSTLSVVETDDNFKDDLLTIYSSIGYNQSIYLLWPLMNILKLSIWGPQLKKEFLASKRKYNFKKTGNRKYEKISEKWSRRHIDNLIIRKDKEKKFLESQNSDKVMLANFKARNTPAAIPKQIQALWMKTTQNKTRTNQVQGLRALGHASRNKNSLNHIKVERLSAKMQAFKSYASIVYGTKICKWVKMQQMSANKRVWYNKIYQKHQFFELELEFFQLINQYYHG